MAENLLTISEAMEALGVSRSTLWRRLRSGELASVTRRGRRLVRLTMTGKAARGKAIGDIPAFTENHPIFRLVGAGRGGGQLPGARDKHAILDARGVRRAFTFDRHFLQYGRIEVLGLSR